MLESLTFDNYKCFQQQTITFRPSTVVVGRNNAGKSTIVEALRLVALVANRAEHLRFQSPPESSELHKKNKGVSPSIEDLDLNFEAVFHRYSDPPASILAKFANGCSVQVFLGAEKGKGWVHGVIRNSRGKVAQNAAEAKLAGVPRIAILPQVAPVAKGETILSQDHVRRNLSTSLSSQHFRNQINLFHHFYSDFRAISEETWPGLRIDTFSGHNGKPGDPLQLLVQNDDFVAEVSWMGHGLQMWLQTMWFLARSGSAKIVMLDEPDVYMHPDLQRRLIRFLRKRFPQTIVTTHSVEMLSEVNPEEMLVIDRKRGISGFADSMPAMQTAVDHMGAMQNIQLSRLWGAKKLLLVEGDDMQILRRFHDLVFPDSLESLGTAPNHSVGGWGGWNYAVGSSMLLQNAGGETISTYCILDSDFHTPTEIERRLADAGKKNVRLHIWARKEIENYLISASAIVRIIAEKSAKAPTPDEVFTELRRIADSNRNEIQDNFAESFFNEDRAKGYKVANQSARSLMEASWAISDGPLERVSGKILLSAISEWSKSNFGVSFGVKTLLRVIRREELASEVIAVISAIDANESMPNGRSFD